MALSKLDIKCYLLASHTSYDKIISIKRDVNLKHQINRYEKHLGVGKITTRRNKKTETKYSTTKIAMTKISRIYEFKRMITFDKIIDTDIDPNCKPNFSIESFVYETLK